MNKNNPLVSIIVNCHNGQKYLSECIKSIINQTYKNWEIIFWDNCSTDNSINIIDNFKDKRIKIFKSKVLNNLYQARNLAIKKCRGKYVSFLDVDDIWLKRKLEVQINEISKDNSFKILYSNYFVFLDKKNKKYLKFSKKLNSGFIAQDLLNSYDIGILTVLIEKKFFRLHKFKGHYNIIGDFDFFIQLSLNNKIKAIQKPLAIYRIHDKNFSSNKINIYIKELLNWLKINKKKKFKNYSFYSIYILLIKLKIKFYIKKFFNIKLGM